MSGRAVSRWCGMLVLVLGYAFGASAQDAPGIPDLQNPSDGSLAEPTSMLLTWSPADGASRMPPSTTGKLKRRVPAAKAGGPIIRKNLQLLLPGRRLRYLRSMLSISRFH